MITNKRSAPDTALHAIGSLWFAAVLLVLLLVAMACATVNESAYGAGHALRAFYHSNWFFVLMCLLAANILASLLARLPFSRARLGFAVTHVSLLIVFVGALVTKYTSMLDGQIGLSEGQTVNQFLVPSETIAVKNQRTGASTRLDFQDAVRDLDRPTDKFDAPPLALDELRVDVVRYFPDSAWRRHVHNDNPRPQAAVEASFGPPGREEPAWIFTDRSQEIAGVPISFSAVTDREEFDRLINPPAETSPPSKGRIRIEHENQIYEFTVEEATDRPVPLGDAGLSARVRRYLPHATVNAENQIVNVSDKPVNPYVEVELAGPGVSEVRKAFARFPNFQAMHGSTQIDELKLSFLADTDAPPVPIEVLAGPDGELYARFTHPGDRPAIHKLAVGASVESPWMNYRFTLASMYENAREEWTLDPVAPPRPAPKPAVLLKCAVGEQSSEVWLQKYQVQAVAIDQTAYELSYDNLTLPLGFSLTLESFRIGTYPGTQRPRSFESHVAVTQPATGRVQSQVISMNHPAEFGGYKLYQSSYDLENDRPVSFLRVARDPGQPIVFTGYVGVMIGMIVVLATRLSKRKLEKRASLGGLSAVATPIILLLGAATASAAEIPTNLDMSLLRGLPTQHDGRWPPLDTAARDLVESVTGDHEFQSCDPVTMLLAWTFDAEKWMTEPLIEINEEELRAELLLPESQTVFSYAELAAHEPLHRIIDKLTTRTVNAKMNPLEAKVDDINRKLILLQDIFTGQAVRLIPHPTDVGGAWRVIQARGNPAAPHGNDAVRQAWTSLGQAFLDDDAQAFAEASRQLSDQLQALPAAHRPSARLIDVELRYNRLRPFRTAWIVMAFGAVLSAVALLIKKKWSDALAIIVMIAGFAVLTYGLSLRWQIAGRIPAANMYESLLFLSWGMGAFAILAMFVQRQRVVPLTASFMGALALLLSDVLPMDGYIRPIQPVLLDTIWMSIHVPIIMVSYSVLALAVLIAHVQMVVMAAAPSKRELAKSIDMMHYYYVMAGSILLAAGIITGSMWAASSWGRYWGWDPKEVWSLIAFFGYMAILHVRISRERVRWWMFVLAAALGVALFSIVAPQLAPLTTIKLAGLAAAAVACCIFVLASGPFADALKSITAFWMIVMTYLGVNYVLGTGLHSYGFGMGAVAEKMLIVGGIDLALMILCSIIYLAVRLEKNPDIDAAPA